MEVYALPYDPRRPQVCLDERPCQLLSDSRPEVPMKAGQPARYDYEYVREGTCNLFMAFQPLTGWRQATVTAHRTKIDFAEWLRDLVDRQFSDADKICLVLDNLNIHSPASLYAAFAPAEACRLLHKLEFHYSPKHGSWLNMVEIELSVLVRQCLRQRIPDMTTLQNTVTAWQNQRNAQRATVHWQFSVEKVRTKLSRLYPLFPVR